MTARKLSRAAVFAQLALEVAGGMPVPKSTDITDDVHLYFGIIADFDAWRAHLGMTHVNASTYDDGRLYRAGYVRGWHGWSVHMCCIAKPLTVPKIAAGKVEALQTFVAADDDLEPAAVAVSS